MANNKGLGLQQTKGEFVLRGIVTGVERDKFYSEISTKTNKPMRMINMGIEVEKEKNVYVNLNGMERDTVYFSKSEGKGKDRKIITEKVKWNERSTFRKDGFQLIGVRLGLNQIIDNTGKSVNDKKTLTEYDACKYISENAQDGMSVYVRGRTEFSTYNDSHQTKFVPSQISLCKAIDFDDEGYEIMSNFTQTICYMGIEKNSDGDYTVLGKIIGYNSIEDAEFIIKSDKPKLAKNLKSLKPYTSIKIYGDIVVEHDIDEIVEEDDGWGESNKMDRVNNPTKRTLVILGADKDSIDTEIYSEDEIESALEKVNAKKNADKDFGSDDDGWGTVSDKDVTDDDDEWD